MAAVITLLVGHRGTGKSSFLRKLEGVPTFDLDEEISRRSGGESVAEIFKKGEARFRDLERETLAELAAKARPGTVIAVGAGFEGPVPEGARVIWLERATDSAGRSFLDRPRLDARVSPFAEYKERFFERERRFADWAHEEFYLPEGECDGLEKYFLKKKTVPYDLTLLPENFRDWENFVAGREARRWEIRDDLLTEEQIALAFATFPREKIIYSRRAPGVSLPSDAAIDWPLELGEPPAEAKIVSLHERDEDFAGTLQRLSAHSGILKLAVEIKDFTELEAGHRWFMADPARRAFLPRSAKGRWRWYRSLFGPRMPLHFVREGMGSSLDQPLLWQVFLQPPLETRFAAVLGHPVEHSRSPREHSALGVPFVAIDVPEEDFTVALRFLRSIGLKYAAVTAPLKKLAWAQAEVLSREARQAQAVNALYFESEKILAHNTDLPALQEIRREIGDDFKSVWLWGGGGVKPAVKRAWPEAREISARQGTGGVQPAPELLIWAVGRSRGFVWPEISGKPKLVLDLNYGADSPGLEFAVRENLPYQSGLRMFKLQAEFQRAFWRACDAGEWL